MKGILELILLLSRHHASETLSVSIGGTVAQSMIISLNLIFAVADAGIRRDGHLLFEVEMYLQKGWFMVSGVGSS